MNKQELRCYLTTLSRFFATQKVNQDTLFAWYWSVLCEYLENRDTVPFSVLKIFYFFFPPFEEHLKAKGYTLSDADLIRLEYLQARAPHLALLRKIENASPDILYLKVGDVACTRNNSQFIPFAKYEMPKEETYFLDALCGNDEQTPESLDAQYEHFKAYIYTNLVHKHLEFFPPSYSYIEEKDFEELRVKYPKLAEKFEIEASEYLEGLGYPEALEKFFSLQDAENTKLNNLTIEQVCEPIKLKIGHRQVLIDYED